MNIGTARKTLIGGGTQFGKKLGSRPWKVAD
jgi:hypothetical protein